MRVTTKNIKWLYRLGVVSVLCFYTAKQLIAQEVRTEVPIRAVRLSDGTMRFAVPISVGGRQVTAGLDTGSTGLQLLPAAQYDLHPLAQEYRAAYGSGVLLSGHAAHASVGIGAVHGDVVANQVTEVGCVPNKPDRGGSKVPIEEFGILGDGLPRQGFAALLGLRTQRASTPGHPENPLRQLGVSRWIVALPQPDGEAGRLILNPNSMDLAGFVSIPGGAATGEVQACVDRSAPAQTHVCGSALLDTGAPGISVAGTDLPSQVRSGAMARISFGPNQQPSFAVGIRLNDRFQMTHFHATENEAGQQAQIHLGPLPYLIFEVLYDAENNMIAMRPRRGYPGGPVLLIR